MGVGPYNSGNDGDFGNTGHGRSDKGAGVTGWPSVKRASTILGLCSLISYLGSCFSIYVLCLSPSTNISSLMAFCGLSSRARRRCTWPLVMLGGLTG